MNYRIVRDEYFFMKNIMNKLRHLLTRLNRELIYTAM